MIDLCLKLQENMVTLVKRFVVENEETLRNIAHSEERDFAFSVERLPYGKK